MTNQYRSYYLERHAEEILCDEAQQIQEHNQIFKNPLFYVFGKKRPCISCYRQIEMLKINYFNSYHGLFWRHSIKFKDGKQTIRTIDVVVNTLKLLATTTVHITVSNIVNED